MNAMRARATPYVGGRAGRLSVVLAIGLALSGCGGEQYQRRLENTARLFEHMDLLNSHLHREWQDGPTSIRLRVPKQFSLIPAPVEAAAQPPAEGAKPGEAAKPAQPEVIVDERQPKFLNVELPGLRGAFFAPLRTVSAKAGDPEQYGFIYVLSNHHLATSVEQAKTFGVDVAKLLTDAMQMPDVKDTEWENVDYPRTAAFAETVHFRSTMINPPRPIGNSEVQFSCNVFQSGEIQIVVLFVLPRDVEAAERMTDRIPLCLETLRVDGDRLRPITSEAAPASAATGL